MKDSKIAKIAGLTALAVSLTDFAMNNGSADSQDSNSIVCVEVQQTEKTDPNEISNVGPVAENSPPEQGKTPSQVGHDGPQDTGVSHPEVSTKTNAGNADRLPSVSPSHDRWRDVRGYTKAEVEQMGARGSEMLRFPDGLYRHPGMGASDDTKQDQVDGKPTVDPEFSNDSHISQERTIPTGWRTVPGKTRLEISRLGQHRMFFVPFPDGLYRHSDMLSQGWSSDQINRVDPSISQASDAAWRSQPGYTRDEADRFGILGTIGLKLYPDGIYRDMGMGMGGN